MLSICGIRTDYSKTKTNRILSESTVHNTCTHFRIWFHYTCLECVWDLIILAFRFFFTSARAHNSVFLEQNMFDSLKRSVICTLPHLLRLILYRSYKHTHTQKMRTRIILNAEKKSLFFFFYSVPFLSFILFNCRPQSASLENTQSVSTDTWLKSCRLCGKMIPLANRLWNSTIDFYRRRQVAYLIVYK